MQVLLGSYLLNTTANPPQIGWKLAGLAVLFSRLILNGSQDFLFHFNVLIIIHFLNMKPLRPIPAHFSHLIFQVQVVWVVLQDLKESLALLQNRSHHIEVAMGDIFIKQKIRFGLVLDWLVILRKKWWANVTLLTAERIWFKCDLYLRFIPPINLWKICIDLRPISKYFNEPFLRTLRSPRSNNLEIQNDENSK